MAVVQTAERVVTPHLVHGRTRTPQTHFHFHLREEGEVGIVRRTTSAEAGRKILAVLEFVVMRSSAPVLSSAAEVAFAVRNQVPAEQTHSREGEADQKPASSWASRPYPAHRI